MCHLLFLDLVTQITFNEKQKSHSSLSCSFTSLFCSFLQSPVASSY
jgi:hypothetical protein